MAAAQEHDVAVLLVNDVLADQVVPEPADHCRASPCSAVSPDRVVPVVVVPGPYVPAPLVVLCLGHREAPSGIGLCDPDQVSELGDGYAGLDVALGHGDTASFGKHVPQSSTMQGWLFSGEHQVALHAAQRQRPGVGRQRPLTPHFPQTVGSSFAEGLGRSSPGQPALIQCSRSPASTGGSMTEHRFTQARSSWRMPAWRTAFVARTARIRLSRQPSQTEIAQTGQPSVGAMLSVGWVMLSPRVDSEAGAEARPRP